MGTRIMQNQPYRAREGDAIDNLYHNIPPKASERSLLEQTNVSTFSQSQTDTSGSFARVGVAITSHLSEHVLSHPCIVLRRQCQVNHDSHWYHVTPFTLVHPIFNIQRHQSLNTLWKGIGSSLMVKGMAGVTENVLSEITPFPKEVNRHSPLKKIAEHLLLKGITFIIITPFYAASLVETVQSEIASEQPGVLDCLKDGCARIVSLSSPPATRLLPMWRLFAPTLLHGLLHYILSTLGRYTVLSMKAESRDRPLNMDGSSMNAEHNVYATLYPELLATFTGSLVADIMLYPLETILHRLCMQGTRTIIDNTDNGLGVIPIITRYEGAVDCLRSIISEEGILGLYKGFGALILQYGLHVVILRLAKFVFEHLANRDNTKPLLGSELAEIQRLNRTRGQGDIGEDMSMSFQLSSSRATSTPYDTPLAGTRSGQRVQGHTGTGSARPM